MRADSARQALHALIARQRARGLDCALSYSVDGDEYEYATLVYGATGAKSREIRHGWRRGEGDSESLAHTWLWLVLKQAEGDPALADDI